MARIVYCLRMPRPTCPCPAWMGRCRRSPRPQLPQPLPTDRAVVGLRAQPPEAPVAWDGRVTPMVSPQGAHCHALDEGLVCMRRVLTQVEEVSCVGEHET